MSPIKIIVLSTLLWYISIGNAYSQNKTKGITPMHEFFKQYTDSTIIIEYPSGGYESPKYRILSKTKDTINCFTYNPKDISVHLIASMRPKKLGGFLLLKKGEYARQAADINVFFSGVDLPVNVSKSLWESIQQLNIWKLSDDSNYGAGCPKDKPAPIIMDADHHIVHLITKGKIKTLTYYAPAFYEKHCPGNINRQAIIKFEQLVGEGIPLD